MILALFILLLKIYKEFLVCDVLNSDENANESGDDYTYVKYMLYVRFECTFSDF